MELTELPVDISFSSLETGSFLKTITTAMGLEGNIEIIKSNMPLLEDKDIYAGGISRLLPAIEQRSFYPNPPITKSEPFPLHNATLKSQDWGRTTKSPERETPHRKSTNSSTAVCHFLTQGHKPN